MQWRDIYDRLQSQFTPHDPWWPGDTAWELMAGAILVQNTAWTNVEKALDKLRNEHKLNPADTLTLHQGGLTELIRPAGAYTRKATTLKALAKWYLAHHDSVGQLRTPELRTSLLAINGIGPETADVITLYVYHRPAFIFDAYARRMMTALGISVGASYEATRELHIADINQSQFSVDEFAQFHALIVTAGKVAKRDGWAALFDKTHS
ncbi:endonuclease III domain-containing protein [Alloscardovia criceti]|uniref:endonuclease III domain-containing protein n=1 Tax=Alloscardovia criceti TaxID=356828 RepID=UPI00047574C9|nr:hypothetical protein [Alloscardovia criceti]